MKIKQIALACAAALAVPMAAHAAAPTNAFDTTGALVIQMSGATAPDNFLQTIMLGMLKPGFYKYIDNGPGTEFRAFLGEINNTADIPASLHNQKVLFIKRSKGGSVWGVDPVARSEAIQTLKISTATNPLTGLPYCSTSNAADPAITVTCSPAGNDPAVAAANGDERVSDMGVSDVAPFMFKEPFNVEFGKTQLTTAESAALSQRSVNTLMMGIVATAAVSDTAVISDADYFAMLAGYQGDWSAFGVAPAAGNNVVVCRRWPGSGTQTSYNWYFHNFPCTTNGGVSGVSGEVGPARMSDSAGYGSGSLGLGDGSSAANAIGIDPAAGFTVVENSGSGDVRKCLKAAQNGGAYTFKGEGDVWHTVNFGAGGYGAVGVLSLDSQNSTSDGAESAWFFRPQNGKGRFYRTTQDCRIGGAAGTVTDSGVCPNRANLRNGNYAFAAELTMQWVTASVAGQKLDFVNEFIDRAGDPAFQSTWTLALPPTYDPNETVLYDGGKVAKATRNGNMCAPLQRLF